MTKAQQQEIDALRKLLNEALSSLVFVREQCLPLPDYDHDKDGRCIQCVICKSSWYNHENQSQEWHEELCPFSFNLGN